MSREFNPSSNSEESREFAYLGMPKGGRGLDEYEQKMMFNRNELEGKNVLDLGAGPLAKFAHELEQSGVKAHVVSLSPEYAIKKFSQQARKGAKDQELVASKGENLPFRERSFDVIFAFHVDEHVGRESYFNIISEMGRTLKPGGYAKYGPTYEIPGDWDQYREIIKNDKLMQEFEKEGVTVECEDVPESIIPKQRIKDGYSNAFYVPARYIVLRRNEESQLEVKN